jgi:hypothetical protein
VKVVDSVVQLFSANRRRANEEREWKESGAYPSELVRGYSSERDRHKDCLRLEALGYRQVSRELAPRFEAGGMGGDRLAGRGGAGPVLRLVYQRDSVASAAGSDDAGENEQPTRQTDLNE